MNSNILIFVIGLLAEAIGLFLQFGLGVSLIVNGFLFMVLVLIVSLLSARKGPDG